MTVVIRTEPANAAEGAIHQRLIDIAREAGGHRDERITKSLTRIPPTLMGFVNSMSAALLVLVFVYPFHDPLAGTACFTLTAAVLMLANIVMTDLDRQSLQWSLQRRFRAVFTPDVLTRQHVVFSATAEFKERWNTSMSIALSVCHRF